MNNMGFFNPFGSSGSGGGGGGSTANYSVKAITDSSGQVSYKLTKNGTAVGDVISFNGSNMLVSYGGELVVLNSAIAGIEEALDKTYNFTTFTEFGINTQNKTLSQLSAELAAKNLEEGTVVTGRVYSEALPYNNYGNAEVLVNNSILWWKTSSSTISPYSWNAIVVGNTVKMDWTPTYYQLPIASAQSLGGVKIGDNVQIAPDGTISVITTKGDTGTGIASIAKTSSSGLNDIYTITYTDSTTSTFTVTNGATITSGSIGQTGHLILTMSDGRTIDAGALPTDNEVEVTTTSSQPADPNVELWVDLSTQQTLSIPEINDSSTSSIQDTWSCKKIYDEQQRQEEEIGVVANAGAKNIFDIQAEAIEQRVTTVLNPDGGITISCNAAAWATRNVIAEIPAGDYICSLFVDAVTIGGGTFGFFVNQSNDQSTWTELYRKTITSTERTDELISVSQKYLRITTNINNSNTAATNSATIRLMIRPASITDSIFVPYAKTNRKLTVENASQQSEINYAINTGVKNLLKITASSQTHRGVTFTVNDDQTVTVNGTNDGTGASTFVIVSNEQAITIPDGNYILSGCPTGGGASVPFDLRWYMYSSGKSAYDSGDGASVEKSGNTVASNIAIVVKTGQTANNLTFKPMLRPAAITDPTFQPYALPNSTLTPAAIKAVDEGAKNLVDTSTVVSGVVTFTQDSDYYVTASPTNTDPRVLEYDTCQYKFRLPAGNYMLSMDIIETTSQNNAICWIFKSDSTNIANKSIKGLSGLQTLQFTLSAETDIGILLKMYTAKIRLMLCTKAEWAVSQKFVPYRPSWQELAIKEQQNENNILLNTKYGGGRNVGNFAYYGLNPDQSIAAGTITHTESNGEFTFTGAADSSKNYACYLLKKQLIKAGNYVISGISGGSTSTYWFRIGTGVSDTFKMNVTDSGTTLTLDSDTKITLQLVVKSGVSLSNKVFSPMIITAADWANSHDFQQYGESNAQLSSIVQADIDNMTEFKFAKLDELNSSVHFKYGFLIGGGGASSPNKVMLWHIFVNTSNSVYFTKIIGDDTMTLTGSISDGVLTITSSATIYGGLRLIWLG